MNEGSIRIVTKSPSGLSLLNTNEEIGPGQITFSNTTPGAATYSADASRAADTGAVRADNLSPWLNELSLAKLGCQNSIFTADPPRFRNAIDLSGE